MANSFDGLRIYTIDTATPNNVGVAAVTSDTIVIHKIRWVSATAAMHHVRVADINDKLFWQSVASGAQYVEESNWLPDQPYSTRTLNGLRVSSITSGTLYIYKD